MVGADDLLKVLHALMIINNIVCGTAKRRIISSVCKDIIGKKTKDVLLLKMPTRALKETASTGMAEELLSP